MDHDVDDIVSMAVTILKMRMGDEVPDGNDIAAAVDSAIGALGGLAGSGIDRAKIVAEVETREANRVGRARIITSHDPDHQPRTAGAGVNIHQDVIHHGGAGVPFSSNQVKPHAVFIWGR